ncbi:MAG TPA: ABC transporter permease [Candidatus Saccharimonadales bacterium]|nr:ABC transporter permease [Candidatus Saccharimonadales bacterium]
MLAIARQTLRGRVGSFAGMCVILSLSIALLIVVFLALATTFNKSPSQPQRFANAATVIYPNPTLKILANGQEYSITPDKLFLPDAVVKKLESDGSIELDRTFAAQLKGSTNQIGHGWASAEFGPYKLVAGEAPDELREIVVQDNLAKVGDTLEVLTEVGPELYTVSGLVNKVDFESPIFFSDNQAQKISPQVSAIVSDAGVSHLQQIVGQDARVLTGADKSLADLSSEQGKKQILSVQILLGISGGFAIFLALCSIASTFAFTGISRQQEFATLRALGATPQQVRTMVIFETFLLGVVCAVAGTVVGILVAPVFSNWLVVSNITPSWFSININILPIIAAVVLGVCIAIAGAYRSSRQAGSTSPIAALQDASTNSKPISKSRIIWAWVILVCTVAALAWVAVLQPHIAAIPQIYLGLLMMPVLVIILFAPLLARPIVKIITLPIKNSQNALATLACENSLTSIRRTVSLAIPVVLLMGLFICFQSATNTIIAAQTDRNASDIKSQYIITANSSAGFSDNAILQMQSLPSVTVAPVASTTIYSLTEDGLEELDAKAIDPSQIEQNLNISISSGSLADLSKSTVIVTPDLEKNVGDQVDIWLDNGDKLTLTVAAIAQKHFAGGPEAFLDLSNIADKNPRQLLVNANSIEQIQSLAEQNGGQMLAKQQWAQQQKNQNLQAGQTGLILTLSIIGIYGAIVLFNSSLMASTERAKYVKSLRLLGATNAQIYKTISLEAVVAVVIGVVMAALAVFIGLTGQYFALSQLSNAVVVVNWQTILGMATACLALAVTGSLAPIFYIIRKRLF